MHKLCNRKEQRLNQRGIKEWFLSLDKKESKSNNKSSNRHSSMRILNSG